MAMNDPHVRAIHYFVEHDDSVDYRDAAPLVCEDELFCIRADKSEVVMEPKNHYTTEEEAKGAIEGFVRRWEFEAALHARSGEFRLLYAGVDIIDRSPPPPPPGVVIVDPVNFRFRVLKAQARVTKVLTGYPAPPLGPAIEPDDPDASFMLSRLDLYRQGREPLGSVANLCLTVLEDSASQATVGKGGKRPMAANHYRIAVTVLDRVGKLTAKKGGPQARKAEGRSDPFTKEETRFLESSVTAFIRRAAERAADPNGNLPAITMADLPKLPN